MSESEKKYKASQTGGDEGRLLAGSSASNLVEPSSIKEGYLYMQTSGFFGKKFKVCYVVLLNNALHIYESDRAGMRGDEAIAMISLRRDSQVSYSPSSDSKWPLGLALQSSSLGGELFVFAFSQNNLRTEWSVAIGECIRYLSLSLVANSIKEGCINWRGKGEHANRTWYFVLLPDRLLVYPFQPRPNASRPELFQTYLLTPQSAVTNTDYTAFSLSHLLGPCPEGKGKEKEKTEGAKGANDVDAVCLPTLPMDEKERAALPSHCFDFMLPLKAECDSWMSACNKAISTLKYRQQQQSAK